LAPPLPLSCKPLDQVLFLTLCFAAPEGAHLFGLPGFKPLRRIKRDAKCRFSDQAKRVLANSWRSLQGCSLCSVTRLEFVSSNNFFLRSSFPSFGEEFLIILRRVSLRFSSHFFLAIWKKKPVLRKR